MVEPTEVKKDEIRSFGRVIFTDYDSPLNLKCSITPLKPYIKGKWRSCTWTETSEYLDQSEVHRSCVNLYSTNSTHSGHGHEIICRESEVNKLLNTTIRKELSVEGTGEHTCTLKIDSRNHLFRNNWTKWACTFTECDDPECSQASGCTARGAIGVFVSN